MKTFFVLATAFCIALCGCAIASEVPGISPSDFGGDDSAAVIWSILAGQGTWGALLFAIIGLIWKFAKPYLDAWVATKRLGTLYQFAQTAVASTAQTYVSEIRAASADGKLTQSEKAIALGNARATFISLCKTQGIDVVKEYGVEFIDWLLEKFVGDSKEMAAITPFFVPQSAPTADQAQVIPEPPLPDLQPLQPFASSPAKLG